jgi:hypothetical protein
LLLTRSPYTYSSTSRRKTLDALAIDVSDGNEVDMTEGKPIRSDNNQLESRLTVQPSLLRVIAHIGTEYLTYVFGDVDAGQPEAEQK